MTRLQVFLNVTNMFAGMAVVGQMSSLRMEAVLIGRPGDGVGDSLPLVRVGAAPHVVARLWDVAGVGNAVFLSLDTVGCLVPGKRRYANSFISPYSS